MLIMYSILLSVLGSVYGNESACVTPLKLGLCAFDEITQHQSALGVYEKCWKPYSRKCTHDGITSTQEPKEYDTYGIILNPGPNSLYVGDIGDKGWPIQVNIDNIINMSESKKAELEMGAMTDWSQIIPPKLRRFVGIVGPGFDNGKTFILNELTDRNYPSGFHFDGETHGICFAFHGDSIFVDPAGKKRPVSEDELIYRSMTDLFVEELIPEISDVIIYVVKELDADSQIDLKKFIQRVARLNRGEVYTKKLLVVHNYLHIVDPNIVEEHIQRDIVVPYKGSAQSTDKGVFYLHHDKETELEVRHFIMGNKGSKAGNKWNNNTIELLKNEIMTATMQQRDFIQCLQSHLSALLREYFKGPNSDDIKQLYQTAESESQTDSMESIDTDDMTYRVWVFNLFRRARAWVGGNVVIRPSEEHKGVKRPTFVENSLKDIIDPFELELVPIDTESTRNGYKHHYLIMLKRPRILATLPVREIGQIPTAGPDVQCRTFEDALDMKAIWVLECDVAGAELSEKKKNEYFNKIGIELDKINTMVSVFGTITRGIDINQTFIKEYGKLSQTYADTPDTSGWFWKSYKAPNWIQIGWKRRITHIVHGRLLVIVDARDDED
eukprot:48513_1